MRRHVASIAALVMVTVGFAVAAEPPAVLSGRWVASAGKGQVLGGTWSAQVQERTPNAAIGSWTLMDEKVNVLLQGTWSARKVPRGWRGTWSARLGSSGATLSGTWEADDRTLRGKKTFEDMLKLAQAGEVQIAGGWRAGRTHGNWWLKPILGEMGVDVGRPDVIEVQNIIRGPASPSASDPGQQAIRAADEMELIVVPYPQHERLARFVARCDRAGGWDIQP